MNNKCFSQFFWKGFFRALASLLIGIFPAIVMLLVLSLSPADVQATSVMPQPYSQATPFLTNTVYLPLVMRNYDPTLPRLISPQSGAKLDTLIPLFVFDAGTQPPNTAGVLDFSTNPDPNRTGWQASFRLASGAHLELLAWDNLQPNTTYYWRVGVIYNFNYSQPPRWTEQYSFTTAPAGGVILPAPTLISPISGTVVAANNVVLQWASVSGAVEYDITVHDMDRDWWYGFSSATTQLTVTSSSLIVPGNHYEWAVTARNNYAWGAESEWWRFNVAASASSLSRPILPEDFVILKLDEQKEILYPKR